MTGLVVFLNLLFHVIHTVNNLRWCKMAEGGSNEYLVVNRARDARRALYTVRGDHPFAGPTDVPRPMAFAKLIPKTGKYVSWTCVSVIGHVLSACFVYSQLQMT